MDEDIDVTVTVDGTELSEQNSRVIELYTDCIETYLRKDSDYGSSFYNSAKVESILKHGHVVPDEIPQLASKQIFVRGILDKMSRFYQLQFSSDEKSVNDESRIDSLLDMANYAILLASILVEDQSDD